jgi:hypothetical protein
MADFRFWAISFLRVIANPIARKNEADQVLKDAFSAR